MTNARSPQGLPQCQPQRQPPTSHISVTPCGPKPHAVHWHRRYLLAKFSLNRENSFPEYKKLRTKVKTLARKAKKEYFQRHIECDNGISTVWRALNVFTKGHRSASADVRKNLTANVFNHRLLSIAESLTEQRTTVSECPNLLHDFCKQKQNKKLAGKIHLSSHIFLFRN